MAVIKCPSLSWQKVLLVIIWWQVCSVTLVIGPAEPELIDTLRCWDGVLGLKALMLCDTPSARMNCSRNSMFVRPLAGRGRGQWACMDITAVLRYKFREFLKRFFCLDFWNSYITSKKYHSNIKILNINIFILR